MSKNAATVRDYYVLLKPGVMSLIVFTAIAGIFLAGNNSHPYLAIITLLAISISSGGAAAINMWYDADIDKIMKRTKNRPLPLGKVLADDCLAYGVILCVVAVILNIMANNILSTSLLISAILFYVFIYTIWLKRRTPQNIVIGGAAGAFPPLISYTAITGQITPEAIMLFMVIFLWTPPHFWALALYRNDDYKKAKVPMMPVVKGIPYTLKNIIFYTALLIGSTYILYYVSPKLDIIYLSIVSIMNIHFLISAIKLYKSPTPENSMRTFFNSILYLFVVFGAIIIDAWL